ncbi:rac GTPase-activating protein 1-like [Pholidichthys leucotaenia]
MEASVVNLYNQFQSLRAQVDGLNESIEPQFIQMAGNFEECRKKWLRADEDLVSCKEMLAKAETERGALEVKLKHARNQIDVEIRRRQKAEAVYEKLERQLQLIRELLTSENNSVHLSEEQRSALAFLSAHSQAAQAAKANLNSSRRLTTIDESASLLSDISYDQTDDSLEWDSSVMKNVRLRKQQKRRSSRKLSEVPPQARKKRCSTGCTPDRVNESIVAKTTITVPANGGPVEAVSTIEAVPYWTCSRKKSVAPSWGDTTTADQSETVSEAPSTPASNLPAQPKTPGANAGGKKHHFISKTVIKSEFCVPCGKRTKFGKLCLRCQDCRVVTHPECREHCPLPCNSTAVSCNTPIKSTDAALADFAPATSPMIPALVICCIKEIEHRGLREVGLYRLSGHERLVKELKEKLIRGKILPSLHKVEDINVITGILKDFLRNLPEPLLTFHLNKAFMEAAEIQDDDNSLALLYQTISELPQPNRDTLACLMIHLQKVSQSVDTKMDVNNLARVFGPTLVGHAVPDPDPMTILHDTSRQPRVVERLLSIPNSYWSQFAYPDNANIDGAHHTDTPNHKVSILGPVTTPEHQMMAKTPSSSSVSQRVMQTLSSTTLFGSKSKTTPVSNRHGHFFASPQLK